MPAGTYHGRVVEFVDECGERGIGPLTVADLDQDPARGVEVRRLDEHVEIGRAASRERPVQALGQDESLDRDRRHVRLAEPGEHGLEGIGHPRVLEQRHVPAPGGPFEPFSRDGPTGRGGRRRQGLGEQRQDVVAVAEIPHPIPVETAPDEPAQGGGRGWVDDGPRPEADRLRLAVEVRHAAHRARPQYCARLPSVRA